MADSHPHIHPHAARRSTPTHPNIDRSPPDDVSEQVSALEEHLVRIEQMQHADRTMLVGLNEAVGSSLDAATGAEGRGMRRQLAEMAANVSEIKRDMADVKLKVNAAAAVDKHEGGATVVRGSAAGTVGAIIAACMATCMTVMEMLKVFGVFK
jgi:hypothetical protein